VCSIATAMSGKAAICCVVIVVSVWTLVAGGPAERRTERSVASQDTPLEMNAELATEVQWLREKTAQVFHYDGNTALNIRQSSGRVHGPCSRAVFMAPVCTTRKHGPSPCNLDDRVGGPSSRIVWTGARVHGPCTRPVNTPGLGPTSHLHFGIRIRYLLSGIRQLSSKMQ